VVCEVDVQLEPDEPSPLAAGILQVLEEFSSCGE
jgi:hypothetical protein